MLELYGLFPKYVIQKSIYHFEIYLAQVFLLRSLCAKAYSRKYMQILFSVASRKSPL